MFRRSAGFFMRQKRYTALTFQEAAQRNEQLKNGAFEKTNIICHLIRAVMDFDHYSSAAVESLLKKYGAKLTMTDVCDMHIQLLRYNVNSNNYQDVANRMEVVKLIIDRMQKAKHNMARQPRR